MSWEEYYKKFENKPPRPLLIEVLKTAQFPSGMTAIDLGCGAGVDTLHLLRNQWNVVAVETEVVAIEILQKSLEESLRPKLSVIKSRFEDLVELPSARLFFASLSLPFCQPEFFPRLWQIIEKSILPNGYFAGHFFGPQDDWVQKKGLYGINSKDLRELFKNFEIIKWDEKNELGPTALGLSKNWHIFTLIAKKMNKSMALLFFTSYLCRLNPTLSTSF